jgi:bifunctional UDP-N-acetylglucosamine pyrophosphorylase / glucosamine-1-phosphate N-acetyltransferase
MGKSAIVLAAGFGSRMKSKLHKVLHPVCGKPMIVHILDELEKLQLDQIIVVVGQQRESVEAMIGNRAQIAFQSEQLGTGHAVLAAVPFLSSESDMTIVLYGDAPLIQAKTMEQLFLMCQKGEAAATVLTAKVTDPTGLGRVFLDANDWVERIVEEKDASTEERLHAQINTGIYAYRTKNLLDALTRLEPNNVQKEYYLTDTLSILRQSGEIVTAMSVGNPDEIASVNDRLQLAQVERLLRMRILEHWMREGVTIENPETTYVDADVVIERDVTILSGSRIEGQSVIMEDAVIGPDARIVNSHIGNNTQVDHSVILSSVVGSNSTIGPFAYVRPGSKIGNGVKIGDFVEIKNSQIADGAKVSHLAYVGDADIDERVNFSCGAITVNYDGKNKFRTHVGKDSFIGCNVNLIAPVIVGEGAYVVAGTTVTEDVPDDGFAIGRPKQVTKSSYVKQWRVKRGAMGNESGGQSNGH